MQTKILAKFQEIPTFCSLFGMQVSVLFKDPLVSLSAVPVIQKWALFFLIYRLFFLEQQKKKRKILEHSRTKNSTKKSGSQKFKKIWEKFHLEKL